MTEEQEPTQVQTENPYAAALAQFQPTDAQIQELVANAAPILEATEVTAKELHEARMPLKNARITIQKISKELKESALDYQRAVTREEKRLIALIEPTEEKIEERQRALEAADRERKEAAKRAAIHRANEWHERLVAVGAHIHIIDIMEASDEQLEETLDRATEAWQAKLFAAAEENQRRLAEQEAERQRVAAERAELELERQKLEAERNRLAAEQAQREAEREALRRAEQQRQDQLQAAHAARMAEERAELEREQAELRKQQQAEQAERVARERAEREAAARAERERIAAANRPYAEQVRALSDKIAGISDLAGDERVDSIMQGTTAALERYAEQLESGEVTRG